MGWVRGKFGNINTTGAPESGASILKSSDRQFWSAIEPGVKPLVRAIVGKGYDTFSSCEGHAYPGGREVFRAVDVIVEVGEIPFWLNCIKQINLKHDVDIQCFLFRDDGLAPAMTRPYVNPARVVFLIGVPSDDNLQKKTALLLKLFKTWHKSPDSSKVKRPSSKR